VDLQRHALNPTLTIVPGARTAITLGLEHLRDERTADRGVPARNGRPLDTDPATFFGNPAQSRARSTVDAGYAIIDHDFGGVALKNQLRVTRYDKSYQNVYPDNANASSVQDDGTLRLAAYNNANRRTNVFNQTDVTAARQAMGMEHRLLAGVELGHQASTSRRNTGFFGAAADQALATVPVASPIAVATAFRPNGSDADNHVKADIAAVYLQDQVTLAPRWKLLAGVRHDHFRVRLDDRRTTTAPADLERTDDAFSPRLGLIWSPTPGATVYASYSAAFLPSGEQLSLAPNTVDLAPEKANNHEIGVKWDVRADLALTLAVFRLDRDDVRSPDPLHPGFFVKTGQQRTEGVELGLQGAIVRGWEVFAGYAHLNGRITQATSGAPAGARLQLVPNDVASWWNRFELGRGWGAGLGIVHQGESFTTLDNRVALPSFTRTDAALYWSSPGGRARLALNVENVFDKRYFPTADGNNNISPGASRTARLTLDAAFEWPAPRETDPCTTPGTHAATPSSRPPPNRLPRRALPPRRSTRASCSGTGAR
jgi:catecholate siderophore receptor